MKSLTDGLPMCRRGITDTIMMRGDMPFGLYKLIDRRRFIFTAIAGVGALGLNACNSNRPQNSSQLVDAGKLADYSRDGEVDGFAKSHGFMLTTFGGKLIAVSSVCTYQDCIVQIAKEGSGFECPCHGCRYDRSGAVRKGPASNPLVHYVMSVNSSGHVMVDTTQPLIQPQWNRTDSYLIAK